MASSNSRDKEAREVVTSMQGDVAHRQSTVRERIVWFSGQGGVEGGRSAQNGPFPGLVDPDSIS